MIFHHGLLSFISILYLFMNGAEIDSTNTEEDSLKLLSVLFRHGNRTPNGPEELYPTDPYRNEKYYPIGLGQLTNAGKRREYWIGKALRERYNKYLGPYYVAEQVDSRSTDYNRTKMSLELVLASLFPPRGEEVWKRDLNWQPIPYNYLQRLQDPVLLGTSCPNFNKLYNVYVQTPGVQAQYKKYQSIFDYISKNSGLNVTKFQDVYYLSFGLKAEEDWGFKLPEWLDKVWPQEIMELAAKEYFIQTGTTELRRIASGFFLQKLINDFTKKINGTDKEKKIYLYSAHEDNLANLLVVLGVFDPNIMPNYGAYLVFELHRIRNQYEIRIYYENYESNNRLQLLKLPACNSSCEFNQFKSLVAEYLPTSGDFC